MTAFRWRWRWSGLTALATALAASAEPGDTAASRKRAVKAAVEEVAGYLGNTPTIAKNSYIDPRVLDRYEAGTVIDLPKARLPERRQAYEGLAKRTNHAGVKSVSTAMVQAEQYGTPLGAALRTMAKENRDLRMSAAEKKAASLPAKLTVPMIIFFLPVLFVVILGPAIIQIQDTMKGGG